MLQNTTPPSNIAEHSNNIIVMHNEYDILQPLKYLYGVLKKLSILTENDVYHK